MFSPTTKVMIVDDFKTMRLLVLAALKGVGLTSVEEAADGADALPLIEQAALSGKPYDLIISDWNMPKMQGIELLRKVRENALTKNTPFVLVTAESEQKQVLTAIQNGASGYIVKPFSPVTFREKLEAVYQKHKA